MTKRIFINTLIFFILICVLPKLSAGEDKQEEKTDQANVVISKVTKGSIAPEEEYVGTVYYIEVSNLSSEASGMVESITFEEGQRTEKGAPLVKLNSDLLEKKLQARVASYEQILSDLERARSDYKRIEDLYSQKIVAEKDYDDQRFQVEGLEKKADALKAEVEHLEIELKKTLIKAPFNGVIIKKHVARGDWLSPGKTVATIASDGAVDLIVEVPETVTKYLRPGMEVDANAGGKEKKGVIAAIIPKGDVTTRTFPIKIRISNGNALLEGMEARVKLPIGDKINALLVPRDAVLNKFGETMVVLVVNSKAKVIPVKVVGYKGMMAGINAKKISKGMKVVVKGNERLMEGQPVSVIKEVE
jgi:membrane fusion protein (multidrug efflux system)